MSFLAPIPPWFGAGGPRREGLLGSGRQKQLHLVLDVHGKNEALIEAMARFVRCNTNAVSRIHSPQLDRWVGQEGNHIE